MRSLTQLVLLATLAAVSLAAVSPVYNVTSGMEDYTLLVGRHMQNDLDRSELQIASVKARHSDRMESIIDQQQLVLQEVQQFDNNMVQRQAFSLSDKHCVQKYKSSSPTFNDVNGDFTKCLANADANIEHFTSNAEANLKNARKIREVEVPLIFLHCNQSYFGQDYLETCVTTQVEMQVEQFNKYIDLIEINLQYSLYTSSVVATEATRCSFVVEKKVLEANGAIITSADACMLELKNSAKALEQDGGSGDHSASRFMQRLRGARLLK